MEMPTSRCTVNPPCLHVLGENCQLMKALLLFTVTREVFQCVTWGEKRKKAWLDLVRACILLPQIGNYCDMSLFHGMRWEWLLLYKCIMKID